MNYLERLSSGDVKTICELIGPRELKQNFRANSNGFNTIKPGFRPILFQMKWLLALQRKM